MTTLKGKTALVTGASRGIGRAIATRLAADGAIVAVHYGADADGARKTAEMIGSAGGSAFILGADLRTMDGVDRLSEGLKRELAVRNIPALDILVNNAGVGSYGSIADTDEETFDRLFDIDVKALFFVTQHMLALLRDGGRIINISSMVSLAAYPTCIAYAAAKAAVNSLTRSAAAELGSRGITVNAVAPGATATDFIADIMQDPQAVQSLAAMAALGRIGETSDIADVVAFMASPAARWITGQVIAASGGMHL